MTKTTPPPELLPVLEELAELLADAVVREFTTNKKPGAKPLERSEDRRAGAR